MTIVQRNIELIRKRRKLKKLDFIKAIDMSFAGYYQMWHNDSCKLKTLLKISEILGVPVYTLFYNSASPEQLPIPGIEIANMKEKAEQILNEAINKIKSLL